MNDHCYGSRLVYTLTHPQAQLLCNAYSYGLPGTGRGDDWFKARTGVSHDVAMDIRRSLRRQLREGAGGGSVALALPCDQWNVVFSAIGRLLAADGYPDWELRVLIGGDREDVMMLLQSMKERHADTASERNGDVAS
jgi:hypothetical protein